MIGREQGHWQWPVWVADPALRVTVETTAVEIDLASRWTG
jgi:hypothetical protein